MSKVLITKSKLDNLAGAISAKSGATLPLTIAQMQTAVDGIVQPTGTKRITENGLGIDVAQYASVDVAVSSGSAILQDKTATITPSETQQTQTLTADTGYDGLGNVGVTVNAIPSNYVGTSVTRRNASDLTVSGATVSVPSGYYESATGATVQIGSQGAPSVVKGSVSNHRMTLHASVTNTEGYISGGTIDGMASFVSASELVSGSQTITENDTYDVTNLASVAVNVSGGASSWTFVKSAEMTITQTSTSNTSKGTVACGSGMFTKDDWIWVRIRDKAGVRAGYMYGTDTIFTNAYKANGSTSTYSIKMTTVIRYSTSSQYACYIGNYGVYPYSLTNSGNISIYARYNSTNTLTIDGTYLIEVYKLTPPTGKTIFAS